MTALSIGNKVTKGAYLASDDTWTGPAETATTVACIGAQVRENQYQEAPVPTWGGQAGTARYTHGQANCDLTVAMNYHTTAQLAGKSYSNNGMEVSAQYNEQRQYYNLEVRDADGGEVVYRNKWSSQVNDAWIQGYYYTGYLDPGDYDCVGLIIASGGGNDSQDMVQAITMQGGATGYVQHWASSVAGNNWTRVGTFFVPARAAAVRARFGSYGGSDLAVAIGLIGVYNDPNASTRRRRPSGLII